MSDLPVTTCIGKSCSPEFAGDVFGGVSLCCPFSHEMAEMWDLSQFLRAFLPTLTGTKSSPSSSAVVSIRTIRTNLNKKKYLTSIFTYFLLF